MARLRFLPSILVSCIVLLADSSFAAAPPAKPAATPSKAPTTEPTTPAPPTPAPTTPAEPDDQPTDEPPAIEPPADDPKDEPAQIHPDAAAVAALQQEARALRDALFKARGRLSLVAAKLFTTRVSLQVRSNLERFYAVSDLTLRLDGAPVYVQDSGMPTTDGDLFEVFAAPGSHELSVSADLTSRRDATYKLRFDHTIVIAVDSDQRVSMRLLLRETGNMWRFARNKRGRSDLRIRLRAQAKSTVKGSAKPKASIKASATTKGSAK